MWLFRKLKLMNKNIKIAIGVLMYPYDEELKSRNTSSRLSIYKCAYMVSAFFKGLTMW
jgi:hypothetical protein